LVLKDDGLIAGTVTRWEWYTSSLIISGVVHNFWIKLSHTSRDKLVDDFELNYDGHKPVKVFATEDMGTIPPSYTWFGFDFSPGFEYNGEDNLIVEVYWKDRDGTLSIGTFWTPYEARCCMCVGISTTEPAVFDFVHYMRATISPIAVEPTSLGRVKAVFQ
jgi:hypothetical protein